MEHAQVISALLNAILPAAAFDGWSDQAATAACKQANISEFDYQRACPNGITDLIVAWIHQEDRAMVEWANAQNLTTLRVRDRIKQLVLFIINHIEAHKEAARRAFHTLALPWNAPTNLSLLHGTVDQMWLLAGDQSSDYNWYTKRLLLSAVYSSTLMCWFGDESANHADTTAFLDRRIDNVMWIGGKMAGRKKA